MDRISTGMDRINEAVSWYQHKIGSYDKQLWERSVEKTVLKNIHNVPKKIVKHRPELIDVDLIRGSTFPKTKPRHGWMSVSRTGLFRVVFMPVYFRWWSQQTNVWFTVLLLVLYTLQVFTLVVYFMDTGQKLGAETLSLAHVVTPVLLMIILGLMHAHIVATHESHRPRRKHLKRHNHDNQRPRRPRDKSTKSEANTLLEQEIGIVDTSPLLHSSQPEDLTGLRQRRFSSKTLLNRRRSGSIIKNGSTSDLRKEGHEADDESEDESKKSAGHLSNSNSREICESQGKAIANGSVSNGGSQHYDSAKNNGSCSNGEEEDHIFNCTLLKQSTQYDDCSPGESMEDVEPSETGEEAEIAPCSLDNVQEPFGESTGEIIDASYIPGDPSGCVMRRRENKARPEGGSTSTDGVSGDRDSGILTRNDTDTNSEVSTGHVPEVEANQNVDNEEWDNQQSNGSDRNTQHSSNSHPHDPAVTNHKSSDTDHKYPEFEDGLNEISKASGTKKPGTLHFRRKFPTNPSVAISSCDSEGEATTPHSNSPKLLTSDVYWGDTGNTDMTTCTDSSTNSASDSDLSEDAGHTSGIPHIASVMNNLASSTDKVSCMIWEEEDVKKIDLTVIDIGWTIIQKVDKIPETCDYLVLGMVFSVVLAVLPGAFRLYHSKVKLVTDASLLGLPDQLQQAQHLVFGAHWSLTVVVANAMIQRCFLGFILFFMLSVAERTFKQRLLYAKHFCYLTSSRRARKYEMPHFRLNKVRNIKTWFSLRSYLKKRGPQRSVDTIVSAAFILEVVLVSLMCFELLQDSEGFLDHLGNWELVVWCMALAVYLLRFMTLGTKINKKYRNFSVLITEQINLYLQMEQKPHKKDELMMANSVLKLAEALLKELEIPFKISGLSANPFLYNITKVILLSAFSAVLTELLGFKLKLYKIKLRA